MENKIEQRTYTSNEVAKELVNIQADVAKVQSVLDAFKNPLEDSLFKEDRSPSYYQDIVEDLQGTFNLLVVIADYLVKILKELETELEHYEIKE